MSTTMAWNEKLSLGVKGIDRQHQELLRRANALFEAIGSDAARSQVDEMVGFFGKYVRTHFACEEKLMRRAHYPDLPDHLAAHREVMRELEAVERLYDQQGLSGPLVQRMTGLVFAWMTEHFTGPDKALAGWLASEHRRRAAA